MAFEATERTNILELIFQNLAWANIGDASGLQPSGAAGNFYISLHTANPAGGNQTTSECTYTSYARVAVVRSAGGWTVMPVQLLFPKRLVEVKQRQILELVLQ
jgi:hypothetical protein